uniref:Reverse transcriptase domain-containing protein n=1 Tax=Nicotiana tabacum TaxID=4097 RepID=A0A1S4A0A6_TOBAC
MTVLWLVGGDFNVIWDEEEKFSGLPMSLNEVDAFRNCINTCNLTDLGFKGSIFTWWNGRAKEDCIFKRLDRCFAHMEFQQTFLGMQWFKDSDRNPMFFHAKVNGRRRRLKLKRIQNKLRNWIEEEEEIVDEALHFFKDQFDETVVPTAFGILDHVPTLVNMEQNLELIKQPTKEKVKQAVFGLNGHNAGGPDGFTGCFYHSCWDIIGDDIFDMVGFMKGRSIAEDVLLTQEIITNIRLRTKAGPNVVMKLDMTKAYDRISWLFLTKMLRKMGFCERFIGLVYGIVSNNLYFALINGQPHGFFKSTKSVKQRDPVSPNLFILAAEVFPRGLNVLNLNRYFCGFGLPNWSLKINHLAYADDTIIFSSSSAKSLQLLMEVLSAYEAASRQLVNKSKSAIYMHHPARLQVVTKVERITGMRRQEFPFTYLGCPIFYARRKMEYNE